MFLLSVLGVAVLLVVVALLTAWANELFFGASVVALAILIYPAYLAMSWLVNL